MKRFNLMFLSLLMLFHNQNSQAYPFSWFVDACIASGQECVTKFNDYAGQFNDLDVWKKTICVLVGVMAIKEGVSVTRSTWRFFFGRKSENPSQEELAALRSENQELHDKHRKPRVEEDIPSISKKEKRKEEHVEERVIVLNDHQVKQILSDLEDENEKALKIFFKRIYKEISTEINNTNRQCHEDVRYVLEKCGELNQKITQISKEGGYRIAATHVRPADVPMISLGPQTRSPIRRRRTNARIINMPSRGKLNALHQQTTAKINHSSSEEEGDEHSSSSSSEDIDSITASPALSRNSTASTPDSSARTEDSSARTSTSARSSSAFTPHSLDSERALGTIDEEEDGEKIEDIIEDDEKVGYKFTPRKERKDKLPASPLKHSRKRSDNSVIFAEEIPVHSSSAPASVRALATPVTIRITKSTSYEDLSTLKKKKKKDSDGSLSDDYLVAEDDTVIERSSGDEVKDLSARNFFQIKSHHSDSETEKEKVKQKNLTKAQEQHSDDRFYADNAKPDDQANQGMWYNLTHFLQR